MAASLGNGISQIDVNAMLDDAPAIVAKFDRGEALMPAEYKYLRQISEIVGGVINMVGFGTSDDIGRDLTDKVLVEMYKRGWPLYALMASIYRVLAGVREVAASTTP
jgi:hypothetical protein